MDKVLCQKYGFSKEMLRTLAVKYPTILSKNEKELVNYFHIMNRHGILKEEAMDYLIQVPKLISQDLEA